METPLQRSSSTSQGTLFGFSAPVMIATFTKSVCFPSRIAPTVPGDSDAYPALRAWFPQPTPLRARNSCLPLPFPRAPLESLCPVIGMYVPKSVHARTRTENRASKVFALRAVALERGVQRVSGRPICHDDIDTIGILRRGGADIRGPFRSDIGVVEMVFAGQILEGEGAEDSRVRRHVDAE